ncbi:MAG: hypothetical protein E7182_03195 [Erysipelotrichaceae bacterium]|nr:hypothetical protein [Erysipelotrichaceae bacterium]
MKTLVYQAQQKGCGFATVKMALVDASKDKRFAFLPEPHVETSPDLSDLLSYAEKWGLHLRAYETLDPEEIVLRPEFPLLITLREEGRLHMSYLAKRRGKRFLLLDPDRGKRWVEGRELACSFTGVFLRVEGYEKKGEPPRPPRFLSHFPVPSLVFALLPFLLLVLGFLLLDVVSMPMLSLALFAGAMMASLGQKRLLSLNMERFDSRYMDGIDAENLSRRRDLFVHYHAYKRAAFLSFPSVLSHLGSFVAALVFFFLHDLYLAAACSAMALVCLVCHLLFYPHLEQIQKKAVGLEATYFHSCLNAERREETRLALRRCNKKCASFLAVKEFLFLSAAFILAMLFALTSGPLSSKTLILYLLSALYVGMESEKLFTDGELFEQKRRETPYFLHNILRDYETLEGQENASTLAH